MTVNVKSTPELYAKENQIFAIQRPFCYFFVCSMGWCIVITWKHEIENGLQKSSKPGPSAEISNLIYRDSLF